MPYADPERYAEYQRNYRTRNGDRLRAEKRKDWAKRRDETSARRRGQYARATAEGTCARCGNAPALPGRTNCDGCGAGDRARYFKRQWGMTVAQRDAMLAEQGGRCAVCGTGKPVGGSGWCIDHDHGTGSVRGILCGNCNRGLGHFNDDPILLQRAAQYLVIKGGGGGANATTGSGSEHA